VADQFTVEKKRKGKIIANSKKFCLLYISKLLLPVSDLIPPPPDTHLQ
jgi:hypothetical protein